MLDGLGLFESLQPEQGNTVWVSGGGLVLADPFVAPAHFSDSVLVQLYLYLLPRYSLSITATQRYHSYGSFINDPTSGVSKNFVIEKLLQ